jgi:hypothetical protein
MALLHVYKVTTWKKKSLFYNKGRYSLANMVIMGDVVGKSKRNFVAKFWLLKQCCPLIDFDAMKMLFQFLKVRNTPKTHWSDDIGWEITKT